jgi:5-methylcytosine-specific restriction protein A
MPHAAPRQCLSPGCPDVAVIRGRCRAHARTWYGTREQRRGTRQQRGYGAEWERQRARALRRDGWRCVLCQARGYVALATQVDHIRPLAEGGTHALENLRSVCTTCHLERHRQDGRRA